MNRMRRVAFGVVLMMCAAPSPASLAQTDAAATAPPPAEVGIVVLKSQTVERTVQIQGRAVAIATASIRPQVDGLVQKIVFTEGATVAMGDVLYELDPAKFQALLDVARAGLAKAEAVEQGANLTFQRNQELSKNKIVASQTLEDAQTALLQAQADVASAKADIQTATINLDNATIRAPIAGKIGTSAVSIGDLVNANQTDALATIRQLDPINVDLVDTSNNMLSIREQLRSGMIGRPSDAPPKVTLVLDGQRAYKPEGSISLLNTVVSESTGTFSLRASFPNPDQLLLPGMFVRATVYIGETPNAFLVPQRAVSRNAAGEATAYFVGDGDKIQSRVIAAAMPVGNDWLVTSGVNEGDRLVVDGLQKISEGATVKPVPVTIDADGVIVQSIAK